MLKMYSGENVFVKRKHKEQAFASPTKKIPAQNCFIIVNLTFMIGAPFINLLLKIVP